MNKKMFVFISILFSFLVFTNIDNVGAQELIHTAEYQQYFKEYENIGNSKDWYIKKCTYSNDYAGRQVDVYYRRDGQILYDQNGYDAAAPEVVEELYGNDSEYSDTKMLSEAGCPEYMIAYGTSSLESYELLDERYVRGDVQYCEGSLSRLTHDGINTSDTLGLTITLSATTANQKKDFFNMEPDYNNYFARTVTGDKTHYYNGIEGSSEEFGQRDSDEGKDYNFYNMSDYVDFLLDGCNDKHVLVSKEPWVIVGTIYRMYITDSIANRNIGTMEFKSDGSLYYAPNGDLYYAEPGKLSSNNCFAILNDAFDKQTYYDLQIELLSDDVNSIIYQLSQSDGRKDSCSYDSTAPDCEDVTEKTIKKDEFDSLMKKILETKEKIKALREEIEDSDKSYGECEISHYLNETTDMTANLDRILLHLEGEEFDKLMSDFETYNEGVITEEDISDLEDALGDIKEEADKIVEITGTTFDIPGTNVAVDCETLFGANTELGKILREILTWMQILAPIALIILGSLDFGQVVLSGDQEALKKAGSKFMKRCIAAVGLFFVPLMLKIILDTDLLGIESNCIEELTTEQSDNNNNDESSDNGNVIHTPE